MVLVNAGEKENVLIQAGQCSIRMIPQLGGKIASIRIGAFELLQAPLAPYGPRTRTMSFDAGDASGWDECLPSVAACSIETEAGPVSVPDHGDLWRVEWLPSNENAEETITGTLRGECFSLPLTLERTFHLAETTRGCKLALNYQVTNRGSFAAPWSWAAHPLFVVEDGDRIQLPHSIQKLCVEGSRNHRLGRRGDQVNWPIARLPVGGEDDLSRVRAETSGIGDKLFAGPLHENENWCLLERRKPGIAIRIGFDPSATPYLGLWLCYGGWPERPGSKQMCVALEPATAPVDSLAQTGPWSRLLQPGETASWPMAVEFETIYSGS
jgi:galactose mutarotase-like enzyme